MKSINSEIRKVEEELNLVTEGDWVRRDIVLAKLETLKEVRELVEEKFSNDGNNIRKEILGSSE